MTPFFIYLLKVTLCSAVLYGYYYLALRNRPFHQWNRFYLLATVILSLLFPLFTLPDFLSQNAGQAEGSLLLLWDQAGQPKATVSTKAQLSWTQVLQTTYTLIAALLLLHFIAGIMQLGRLLRAAPKLKQKAFVLVLTAHEQAPFSFMQWVFWNKNLDPEAGHNPAILVHEQAHVQQHHSIDKLLLQTVLVCFWANPVFWLIRRELSLVHEFLADEAVLQQSDSKALAAMMLQAGFGKQFNSLVQPFFHQPIKRRLVMLQKTRNINHLATAGKLFSLPLFALALFAFAEKKSGLQTASGLEAKPTMATALQDTTGQPAADSIKEVHVNKNGGGNTITIVYKNGKKETLTAEAAKKRGLLPAPPPPPPVPGTPPPPPPVKATGKDGNNKAYADALVIIDGVEKGTMKDYPDDSFPVKPEAIKSMNVLKDKNATDKYGSKGKNGVIEIETKKLATDGTSSWFNGWIPKKDSGC